MDEQEKFISYVCHDFLSSTNHILLYCFVPTRSYPDEKLLIVYFMKQVK